jgi:hypothetical protein
MGRSRVLSRRAVFPILQQCGLVDVRRRGGHIVIAGPHRRRQRHGSHSERPRARDRLLSITPQSGYIELSSKRICSVFRSRPPASSLPLGGAQYHDVPLRDERRAFLARNEIRPRWHLVLQPLAGSRRWLLAGRPIGEPHATGAGRRVVALRNVRWWRGDGWPRYRGTRHVDRSLARFGDYTTRKGDTHGRDSKQALHVPQDFMARACLTSKIT